MGNSPDRLTDDVRTDNNWISGDNPMMFSTSMHGQITVPNSILREKTSVPSLFFSLVILTLSSLITLSQGKWQKNNNTQNRYK